MVEEEVSDEQLERIRTPIRAYLAGLISEEDCGKILREIRGERQHYTLYGGRRTGRTMWRDKHMMELRSQDHVLDALMYAIEDRCDTCGNEDCGDHGMPPPYSGAKCVMLPQCWEPGERWARRINDVREMSARKGNEGHS